MSFPGQPRSVVFESLFPPGDSVLYVVREFNERGGLRLQLAPTKGGRVTAEPVMNALRGQGKPGLLLNAWL